MLIVHHLINLATKKLHINRTIFCKRLIKELIWNFTAETTIHFHFKQEAESEITMKLINYIINQNH